MKKSRIFIILKKFGQETFSLFSPIAICYLRHVRFSSELTLSVKTVTFVEITQKYIMVFLSASAFTTQRESPLDMEGHNFAKIEMNSHLAKPQVSREEVEGCKS